MKVNPELIAHDGLKDSTWRKLLAATIGKYLAADFEPQQRLSARKIAQEMGLDVRPNTPSLAKVDIYALAAAAIHLQTQHWLTGAGPEARVREEWLPDPKNVVVAVKNKDPVYGLAALLRGSYVTASAVLEQSGTSHLPYFFKRFDTLARRDTERYEERHTSSESIRLGGTLINELTNFSRVTARALRETPETSGFSEAQRIDAAHKLLPISTARASQHIDTLLGDGMNWFDAEEPAPHIQITESRPRNSRMDDADAEAASLVTIYELLGPENEALFLPAMTVLKKTARPILKCPAHQRFAGAETALQLQLHAGINHLAEHGVFHPGFVPPPVV